MTPLLKDMLNMHGKVAVITGGAGILGPMHAEALAEFGATVILADINEALVKEKAAQIHKRFGTSVEGMQLDITKQEHISRFVQAALHKFGRIDVLINNAQASHPAEMQAFETYPKEIWDMLVSVNLTGAVCLTQEIIQVMLKQGNGNIINISSSYGIVAPDQRIYSGERYSAAAYTATKCALIGVTKFLAAYYAHKNIRVNCLSPSTVRAVSEATAAGTSAEDTEFIQRLTNRIPMGRMSDKHEFKGAILYLASDASSYMTGHNLVVDGGLTAW